MPIRQRLATTDDGRPVVIKQAATSAEVERLVHEATVLRAAAHPGVVEVLAERSVPGGRHELMLLVAGTRTAGDLRLPLAGVAGLLASLATTVADLHDLGVVHGRVQADHVVIDADGRPVLCGFGDAVSFEAEGAPAVARAADVAGLGDLLRHLVTAGWEGGDGWAPIPERRFGFGDRWAVHARRALLNVADHASADDVAARPDARTLATDVVAALPDSRIPGAAGRTGDRALPSTSVSWPRRRFEAARLLLGRVRLPRRLPLRLPARPAATRLAAALGLGLLVFGLGSLLRTDPRRPPAPEQATGSRRAAVASAAAVGSARPPACPDVAPDRAPGSVLVDHDGDGCRSAVQLGDGEVALDGVRYAVGAPGDLLAVGDWDCDGAATIGLVERPSGLVFLFPSWATGSEALETASIATVEAAEAAAAHDPDGDGCARLLVTGDGGRRTEVGP